MLKKLQLKIYKCLFIVSLLFLILKREGIAFSQDNPDSPKEASSPSANNLEEDHDTKDLEDLLKKYNKDQIKVIEDNSKLHNIDSSKSDNEEMESEIEALANTKKVEFGKPQKKVEMPSKDDKLSNSIRIALGPLQSLSDKELEARFIEASKQSKFYPYIEKFPKSIVFGARLIKDKEAIPSLVQIVEDKKRLITCGAILILSIFVGLTLKKLFHSDKRSFLGVIFFFLLRVYLMLFLRIGIIYYYFSNELKPTVEVFKKVFL